MADLKLWEPDSPAWDAQRLNRINIELCELQQRYESLRAAHEAAIERIKELNKKVTSLEVECG